MLVSFQLSGHSVNCLHFFCGKKEVKCPDMLASNFLVNALSEYLDMLYNP